MNLDYDVRGLDGDERLLQGRIDDTLIEYAQEKFEHASKTNRKQDADFYYWVLHLVDRLEEAAYEWEEQKEEIQSLQRYIEDWQVGQNIGKHFESRY